MSALKIIMYTKPFCGFCAAAKALFREKDVSYTEIDIGGNATLREEMMARSGRSTVPQIFINDEHIGGYDDMAALEEAGEFDSRLGR
ncbi:MAG: glutaredoxin 3 [Gammaproteobacteria bacterium]|jgi:glutaredoxin 3|tara:strand:+ start:1486 stop:1746 length:261 start_codon:yes stop_codon:yes gene_type:complete